MIWTQTTLTTYPSILPHSLQARQLSLWFLQWPSSFYFKVLVSAVLPVWSIFCSGFFAWLSLLHQFKFCVLKETFCDLHSWNNNPPCLTVSITTWHFFHDMIFGHYHILPNMQKKSPVISEDNILSKVFIQSIIALYLCFKKQFNSSWLQMFQKSPDRIGFKKRQ